MPRTVIQLLVVLVALLIPKEVQEWLLHWEELHPWQWLRNEVLRPLLGR
jgi:hypothetical protein